MFDIKWVYTSNKWQNAPIGLYEKSIGSVQSFFEHKLELELLNLPSTPPRSDPSTSCNGRRDQKRGHVNLSLSGGRRATSAVLILFSPTSITNHATATTPPFYPPPLLRTHVHGLLSQSVPKGDTYEPGMEILIRSVGVGATIKVIEYAYAPFENSALPFP